MIFQSRRAFLGFLGSGIIAAPAIVRAASIMPVKAWPREPITYSVGEYRGVIFRETDRIPMIIDRQQMADLMWQHIRPPLEPREMTAFVRIFHPTRT